MSEALDRNCLEDALSAILWVRIPILSSAGLFNSENFEDEPPELCEIP
jgi:hypothetical protein